MKKKIIVLVVLFIITIGILFCSYLSRIKYYICCGPQPMVNPNITVDQPTFQASISSPLVITGKARGSWYFEASFPVVLVDWDGKIIAQVQAQAQSDWMTTDFVPFKATLDFTKPINVGPQSLRGAIIFKKDNPSGLPKNDAAVEIPVTFK